jgi:hypothetical protein
LPDGVENSAFVFTVHGQPPVFVDPKLFSNSRAKLRP